MKKILITFACIAGLFASQVAMANPYKLDETAIDVQFEQSQDVTSDISQLFIANELSATANHPKIEDKQKTAAIVAVVMVITGIGVLVPVHRFILGTDGNEIKIFFAYFCTASGCGVGLVIDAIFLLIHMDESNYVDNGNIIMWKDNN